MNRNSFQRWGVSLTDTEFARALLGAGLVAPPQNVERPILWEMPLLPTKRSHDPQGMLERAGLLLQAKRPRIEIGQTPREVDKVDLWRTLADLIRETAAPHQPEEAGSVYLRVESPTADLGWRWPLRIGVLPSAESDSEERAVEFHRDWQRQANYGGWVKQLFPRLVLGPAQPECDVLVLPMTCAAALQRLLQEPGLYAADLVLVLAPPGDLPPGVYRWLKTVLTLVRCSGVALVQTRTPYEVFETMARLLSHNLPLDRALFGAVATTEEAPPLILATQALMLRSQLEKRLISLADNLRISALSIPEPSTPSPLRRSMDTGSTAMVQPIRSMAAFALPVYVSSTLGVPKMLAAATAERLAAFTPAPAPDAPLMEAVADGLMAFKDDPEAFSAELHGGTVTAEVTKAASDAGVNTSVPRFLHAVPYVGEKPPKSLTARSLPRFKCGSDHGVDVHIGPRTKDNGALSLSIPVPEHELPQDLEEYLLDLHFLPLAGGQKAQRTQMLLRRHDATAPYSFFFHVPADAEYYEARIFISYRNRILQTGRLSGPTTLAKRKRGEAVTFLPECTGRQRFSGLQGPTNFAASFVFNETQAGTPAVTRLTDRGVSLSSHDGFPDLAGMADRFLDALAQAPDAFFGTGALNAEGIGLLRKLAIEFHPFYGKLTDSDEHGYLANDSRAIQVFSKIEGERIPVEFIYQSPVQPNVDAALCPTWQDCLTNRKCSQAPAKTHFCPSRFWGLSRVIERHAYHLDFKKKLEDSYFLQAEPMENRTSLPLLSRTLMAGASPVDKVLGAGKGMDRLASAASKVCLNPATLVTTWDAWRLAIKDQPTPDSLLLIVHTELAYPGGKVRKLQIGDDLSLLSGQVDIEVVGGTESHHPLALVLGCHTGTAGDVPFESISASFKKCRAAIVIGSGSLVHVKHAAPFLELFMERLGLALSQPGPISFGEFMRDLRVECVRRGNLIALALTAYGDADWILTKATVSP